MSRQWFFLLIVLLIPLASASARSQSKFAKIVRVLSEPASADSSKLPSFKSISSLTIEQRNQIALLVARTMFEEPNVRSSYYLSLIIHLKRSRLIASGEVITRLNEFAVLAVKSISQGSHRSFYSDALRDLSQSRLINTPDVIPYLIDALDNPDRDQAKGAFFVLAQLTLHLTGSAYWTGSVKEPQRHLLISQWWRAWWEKNRSKRPVFDLQLAAQVEAEMVRLGSLIKENLRPNFSEMSYFIVPQFSVVRHAAYYPVNQSPIYQLEYSPSSYHFISKPDNIENVWLCMDAGFQTPDLPDEGVSDASRQSSFNARHPPEHLKSREQEVYFRTIPGTDIFIRIRFATNNQTLVEALRNLVSN